MRQAKPARRDDGPINVSTETRVMVLIPDPNRTGDAETICRLLRDTAPYCRIRVHAIDPAREFADDTAHCKRTIAAVLESEVVLYLTTGTDRTSAGLIALRERAGFTWRFGEPEYARVWFSRDHKRSLYVLGEMPGALGALALALDLGCADPVAAQLMRDRPQPAFVV